MAQLDDRINFFVSAVGIGARIVAGGWKSADQKLRCSRKIMSLRWLKFWAFIFGLSSIRFLFYFSSRVYFGYEIELADYTIILFAIICACLCFQLVRTIKKRRVAFRK